MGGKCLPSTGVVKNRDTSMERSYLPLFDAVCRGHDPDKAAPGEGHER
jgi:hypothetical protein